MMVIQRGIRGRYNLYVAGRTTDPRVRKKAKQRSVRSDRCWGVERPTSKIAFVSWEGELAKLLEGEIRVWP
jgi:hypothetical protein